MKRIQALVLAGAARPGSLRPQGADLVVWWGFYPREDDALRDVIATFGRESGKQVELGCYPQEERPEQLQAARSSCDSNLDNNLQFLARALSVMNDAVSIPDTLKTERSASTTGTPRRSNGRSDGEAFRSKTSSC
jgi:hypothetical protein